MLNLHHMHQILADPNRAVNVIDQSKPRYLTTGAAARRIGVSRHTMLRAVRRGRIRPTMTTPGGGLRFSVEDIEALSLQLSSASDIDVLDGTELTEQPSGPYDAYVEAFFQVPASIALLALDGSWLLVNPAFCALLGYSQEDLLKLGSTRLTHPDDLENSREAEQTLLAGKQLTAQFQKGYQRKDGRY